MKAEELALVQGWDGHAERAHALESPIPWRVLWAWTRGALAVAALLLGAVWLVASLSTPDPTGGLLPGHLAARPR